MALLLRHTSTITNIRIVKQMKTILNSSSIHNKLIERTFLTIKPSNIYSKNGFFILQCNKLNKPNILSVSKISQTSFRPSPDKNQSIMLIMTSITIIVLGLSYAAVPLYRIYCQKTKKGGQAYLDDDINEKVAGMKKVEDRKIIIRFEADKSSRLAWDFKPLQKEIVCSPGETVLAFYTATNQLDHPVNGIATYTILPYEASKYFNKIQCFCFEEQQLNSNEKVDLPVFFYIDPEFIKDPFMFDVQDIILSYNFFETKEGYKLPKPPAFRAHLSGLGSSTEIATS